MRASINRKFSGFPYENMFQRENRSNITTPKTGAKPPPKGAVLPLHHGV